MLKHISSTLKGFAIGIANIIPGVSGGTLALILGIYDNLAVATGNWLATVIDIDNREAANPHEKILFEMQISTIRLSAAVIDPISSPWIISFTP